MSPTLSLFIRPKHTVFMFHILCSLLFSNTLFYADHDAPASGMEFSDGMSVQLGDRYSFSLITIDAIIEARNEPRFTNAPLPNHNWRGFLSIATSLIPLFTNELQWFTISVGFEHSSAHATMGIEEPTYNPHEMIYDGKYRNANMNSCFLKNKYTLYDSTLTFEAQYHFYFYSRNTPELPNYDWTHSHGISAGIQFSHLLFYDYSGVISLYDQFIFNSTQTSNDYLFEESNGILSLNKRTHPIIHQTNSLSLLIGIETRIFDHYTILTYLKYLYGTEGGYVDSRQVTNALSLGFLISQ